jgi:uncharacterized protein YbaR (Trm112 family)
MITLRQSLLSAAFASRLSPSQLRWISSMDRQAPAWAEVFVCPKCKGGLTAPADVLRCAACRLAYPVVDGIPVLLIVEAMPMAPEDLNSRSE